MQNNQPKQSVQFYKILVTLTELRLKTGLIEREWHASFLEQDSEAKQCTPFPFCFLFLSIVSYWEVSKKLNRAQLEV